MAKGYWIAHAEVTDKEAWQRYVDAAAPAFREHEGRFLARGGPATEAEEPLGRARHVVCEFPSYQAALDCYNSETYQAARKHREDAGTVTIVLVEGLDG